MKLSEIVRNLELQEFTKSARDVDVTGGYASDMLSDVIANAGSDNLWITMQTHTNIVAVAALKDLAGIVIVGGRAPSDEMVKLAGEKRVSVLGTNRSTFNIVGKLYESGVRGSSF